MVQQRSAANRIASPQVHDNDGVLAQENVLQISPVPAKKRRREGVEPPKKRRREQRRGLCELNLDELYIIFAYIYPMDLLNLARTCKSLRGILMHKTSLFLWTTTLRQIEGLPACPADLIEPEYTNLVFYTRCHGCGKPAQTILWNMRRRYCPACRVQRLFYLHCCDTVIRLNEVLPSDRCKIGDNSGKWVDRDQMDSFMREYHSSSDKTEFLNEKRKQYQTIYLHARKCESWQKQKGRVHRHRFDLEVLRKERGSSIFERLRQRGYGPEIAYFGDEDIEKAYKSVFFKKHKSLTDGEWDQMWPEWVKIMDNFRMQRLEATLYQPRRCSLVSEYNRYVTRRSPNTPIFDLLPYVADLACFPPFQDIIKAPEEARMDGELFASAFSQLPVLVGEWRTQLDVEVAELVQIPPHLSLGGVASGRVAASSSVTSAKSYQMNLDKLHLACALFHTGGNCLFTHPEVFLTTRHQSYPTERNEDTPKRIGPTLGRLGIGILEEAPYIVHACGLDPNVATADDMDRRNARLRCLCCKSSFILIMDWRNAMLHARDFHHRTVPLSESPRWQLVSDEHIDTIQAVEESVRKESLLYDYRRCLLCQPRVGDVLKHCQIVGHLWKCHEVEMKDMRRGVHYEHLGITDGYSTLVEMVEEGGQVIFREPQYQLVR